MKTLRRWIRKLSHRSQRVYIMPTQMGGYLNGLIFLLFLLAVGYSNNLLLIFTLFLFALNLMWLIGTHFHMRKLTLGQLTIADAHANEGACVRVFWKTAPEGLGEWRLVLESSDDDLKVVGEQVVLPRRGVFAWKYLKVSTDKPFGLYKTWKFIPLQSMSFAYPTILNDVSLPSQKDFPTEGSEVNVKRGPQDPSELNPYQGEGIKRISWKHYARTGDLLLKEGTEPQEKVIEFKLELPSDSGLKERYLSELATQMRWATQREIPFIFETVSFKRGPSYHGAHLRECLRELARCD